MTTERDDPKGFKSEPPTPLFGAGGTTLFRMFLVAIAVTTVGIPTLLLAGERTPYVTGALDAKMQPVKFDHRHHVRDDGIPCMYCHADVRRSSSAGMPALSVCMGCHAQIWSQSPELREVRAGYFGSSTLAWERVTRLPDFVFFNHSIHIAKGVGCVTCHGRVDEMGQVYASAPFNMAFCVDCHRAPDKHLRPPSEITNMEWRPDGPPEVVGRQVRAALHVDPGTDCSTCHR